MKLTFLGTGTSFGVPQIGCHCRVCRSGDPRDRRTRTDLNVALSKRLLNDRLTVSVGSNFEVMGQQATQTNAQNASNMIGDISINYMLSKDGRYMLRTYRRNQYEGVVEGYVIESGIGFSINMDYDNFSEILHRKKAKVEGLDDKQKPLE